MRTRMASAAKAAVLVVATLVAIGSLEVYMGRRALAQFGLPHFKCYNFVPAGPPVKESGVSLTDRFGSESVTVETRHYLCVPVTKVDSNGFFPADPGSQALVCYHIRPSLGALKTDVTLTDQFRPLGESGEITTPHLLCAPAPGNLG